MDEISDLKVPIKDGSFYKTRGGIKAKCVHVFKNGEALLIEDVVADPEKFSIQATNFWKAKPHGRMRDDIFNNSYDIVSEWHETVMIAPALVKYIAQGAKPYQTECFYSSKEEAIDAANKNGNQFIRWPSYDANWPKVNTEDLK